MTTQTHHSNAKTPRAAFAAALAPALLGLGALLAPAAAHAQDLTLAISPSSAVAGGSGVFDVTLTDTGLASDNIGGFSYELMADPGVTFNSATADGVSTADGSTYIFSPVATPYDITGSIPSPNVINAGDVDFIAPYYTTINPGDTYSLGDISYTLDGGLTPGVPLSVSFEDVYDPATNPGGATDISDNNGNSIPILTTPGTITVLPAAVSVAPEPSQVAVFAFIGLGLLGRTLRARRHPGAETSGAASGASTRRPGA